MNAGPAIVNMNSTEYFLTTIDILKESGFLKSLL